MAFGRPFYRDGLITRRDMVKAAYAQLMFRIGGADEQQMARIREYGRQAEVRCRVCARPVIAWKGAFGLQCPLGPHHARIAWATVAMVVAFWTAVVGAGIGLLVWMQ